ncbi:MAG: glucosylceramidase [Chloroflexota bacterium]|nr:MAG: glucosylceramidase [Chloroflexota bacterium]
MPIRIPRQAWSHPIGVGCDPVPRARIDQPMIDDGPWAGVPVGGIGAGSIGRTQRGDFARWHLRVGAHHFEPVAVDGFALWVEDGGRTQATVLRTTPPPPGWGPALPVGAGTYRALFPRAWFEHDVPDCRLRLTEEQLSPVVPGDDAAASLPVGTFSWEITNPTAAAISAALLLSWRNDLGRDVGLASAAGGRIEVRAAEGRVGLVLRPDDAAAARGTPASMALLVEGGDGIEVTTVAGFDPDDAADVWADFAADGRLTAAPGEGLGSAGAIAARVSLAPGETRTLRFAIAWDIPIAEFGSGRRWLRRYTREQGTSGDGAWRIGELALDHLDAWRTAIEAWQAPFLDDPGRPDWYVAALFNELYFLVDGGTLWPDRALPSDLHPSSPEPALALIECFDYPFYNTLDVHFYASFALSRLWPELEVEISRAFARTVELDDPSSMTIETTGLEVQRKVAGALPHDLGGPAEDPLARANRYRFRDPNIWKDLNPKFVLQLARDLALGGAAARSLLPEAWPAVVRAMDRLASFDTDGDGLPEHDGRPDQTYDTWPMSGPSAYGGGLWLAALRAAGAMAAGVGDAAREVAWGDTFETAAASYERRLWNGRAYRYDDGDSPTSDSLMADQLAGQWYIDVLGLGDLVPPWRVESALREIFERNVRGFGDGEMGAVNGTRPDGGVDRSSEQSQEVWIGTTYALAAFMIGRGLVEEGWQTARGAARMTYQRGFWFRTPEAFDEDGNFRASIYLRPLAIWAIEEALERVARRARPAQPGVVVG